MQQWLDALVEWSQSVGVWAVPVFIGAYVLGTVLFIPGSLLTIAVGFVFGLGLGSVTASLGSVAGASCAFAIGRALGRQRVERWLHGRERFGRLDGALGEQGFAVVFWSRLTPAIPFNLFSYFLGVTRVTFRDFLFASWVGMLPGTILYVALGAGARSFADAVSGSKEPSPLQTTLLVVGIVATLALTVLLTRIARRSLATLEAPEESSEARPPEN
ncbi:MAG: TVP38/TMEM64 family protein [Planctomycetota bacterium]